MNRIQSHLICRNAVLQNKPDVVGREKIKDILNYESFSRVEPIHKGWSKDKKYYVETKHREKLLLRVSDIADYEDKKHEFELMKRISATGINMSEPIDFGLCNDGKSVYQVLTWCEGEEAKELLPSLSEEKQYTYGRKAAEIIKRMETIEEKPVSKEWAQYYKQRMERYIRSCQLVCVNSSQLNRPVRDQ